MKHRKIKHVMTTGATFVKDHTGFKDIVQLLADRRVSAVPVVNSENRVVGVVSYSDLLAKQSELEPPGPLTRLRLVQRHRAGVKAAGSVAADLMTKPAITIDAESTVVHAARTMGQHNVHRLPVVDSAGRLVGIVSQRDLLSVFLRTDNEIRDEIVHDVFEHGLGITVNPTTVDVHVHEGKVTLLGELETKSMTAIAEALTRRVDGVVTLNSQLGFTSDDTHPSHDVPMIGAVRLPNEHT